MPKGPRTPEVARRLVDAYVTSLRQHLPTYCIRQFDKLPGAQEHQLTRLRQSYPGAPQELLYFLRRVNGTCWESLVAPPGSVPPLPSVTAVAAAAAAAVGGESGASPAGSAAATTASSAGGAEPPSSTPPSPTPTAASAAAPAKSSTKPTGAAAAIASEAAAFIKSQIAKKVSGAQRPRKLPHYVALPILGSTYTACPYYLKSVEQMLLAEQQFPPASANLPDEGDSWRPPPPQAASSTTPSAPNTAEDPANTTKEGNSGGSLADATPCGAPLNKNTIASVFAGCKILYGAPPTQEGKAAAEASGLPVTPVVELSTTNTCPTLCSGDGDSRVVYVDPRIDINANFYQWLAFADSVQPHVRERVPTIPDADPAKVAAAAAAAVANATATAAKAAAAPVKVFAASRLYLDFQPVELQGGVHGQVIQFVHGHPSSFTVVSSDFGSYLKYVMAEEYEFTEELEDDEDDDDDGEDMISTKSSASSSSSNSGGATASSGAASAGSNASSSSSKP